MSRARRRAYPLCMSDVRVRAGVAADLPALRDLWRQLEAVQGPARTLPPVPDAEERALASFAAAVDDPDARLLVAERDGRVVGMALARLDRPSKMSDEQVVDLGRVVVREGERGRGVGEALVDAAEEFARARGVRFLSAKIFAANAGAVAFWERLGFGLSFELRMRRIDPSR